MFIEPEFVGSALVASLTAIVVDDEPVGMTPDRVLVAGTISQTESYPVMLI